MERAKPANKTATTATWNTSRRTRKRNVLFLSEIVFIGGVSVGGLIREACMSGPFMRVEALWIALYVVGIAASMFMLCLWLVIDLEWRGIELRRETDAAVEVALTEFRESQAQ